MRIRQAKHTIAWRLYDLLTHLVSPASRTPRLFWGPVMAQPIFRRRGTGSYPTRVERPDGSPVDGVHPCASALAVSALLASMLGSLAANRAVTTVGMTAYVAGGPPGPAATRLVDYRDENPRRADSSNSRGGAPVDDDLRVETVRQRWLAQSLIYTGGAALVIAGSGLLLVGVRRRLW
jgi:hypothetical protein